ncbi:MAG TPA: serine hydrolase domain-containing protein [Vicinamibacteria bacterium]|nr:serine hydrolase domain-containing protein [Vicinamibacteria bacterium]
MTHAFHALTLVLVLSSLPFAAAQPPPDAAQQVDAIFEPWSSLKTPGCAVGVAQKGLTVLSRAYGMADLEHDIPNAHDTIFEGGSVSKQFTAAAVILLALDGKLSLDDDVRKYVPEVPDYGDTITLRHMMNHTSGLRDWGSVAGISGWGRQERTHTHAHVIDIVSRQSALNFEPGHEYSYCNTGFNLLAIIVSRVSGMSFAEFSKKRLFEPLGMAHTQWRDDYTRIVKNRSTAYSVEDGDVTIMRPIENVHGNGGILTTVGDLLLWNQALSDGRLGGADFTRMMLERGRLNDGRQISYASGLVVSSFAGVPSITHTGSTSGYRAFLGRYPEQELSVAMLCNASNVPTSETGEAIARVYLGDEAKPPVAPREHPVTAEALSRVTGLYRNTSTGVPLHVALENGSLQLDGWIQLVPVADSEFQSSTGSRRVTVEQNASGERLSIRMVSGDGDVDRFEPVEPFSPDAAQRSAYEGEYTSYDAETNFVISVVDGELTLHRRPGWKVVLQPEYEDAFDAPGLGFIRFHRDANRVVDLSLRLPRVYDMRFQRTAEKAHSSTH